jgi:transposase
LRGVKVEDVRRGRKFGRTNVIAAQCNGEIWAPKTYNHTTNGQFFLDWFEYDLLSIVPSGHTIIMDNASFHPKKKLKKIADRYGIHLLFLPHYSPDFNTIEKFWANLKQWLKDFLVCYDTVQTAIMAYCVRFLS